MEIYLCEELYNSTPLGICRQMIKICPDNSFLEQSERHVDRTVWCTIRKLLWYQRDSGLKSSKCTIDSRQEMMPRVVLVVWHQCSQWQPPNQKLGPHSNDSHGCGRTRCREWGNWHIFWLFLTNLQSDGKRTPFPTKRLWKWQKYWLPTSATSEYCGSYVVTRAITLSHIWWRCCNVL
jgi:hypothetical protein